MLELILKVIQIAIDVHILYGFTQWLRYKNRYKEIEKREEEIYKFYRERAAEQTTNKSERSADYERWKAERERRGE